MKKTKKYYREAIAKDYASACSVINEAVVAYGKKVKKGYRHVTAKSSMGSNGSIEGFYFDIYHNQLSVDVYWQGDHTDGNKEVLFDKNGLYLEEDYDENIHQMIHEAVEITSEQLYEAMKEFANTYLKK